MKKNTFLYILLFFLIIVNGFFLYNYLGKGGDEKGIRKGDPLSFIVKQLDFDDKQTEEIGVLNKKHHRKMMRLSDETRDLKDALFGKISDVSITDKYVDSVTHLIGKKEAEKDKEVFHHFKKIEDMCSNEQKEKFKSIIKEALGKGARQKNRPSGEGGEGRRLPPMDGERMGPPPMDGEHIGPPPNH